MSWLGEFEDELATRGIRPAVRERLVTEFADHIACEQGAATAVALTRLGVAREIAGQYADELAADGARHGAFAAFAALGCAAAALVVSQLTLGQFVGYPGFDHGFSAALALPGILAMLVGPQVALVGGTLAAWRAIRRRREPVLPAAEIALLRRRARVGLLAGIVTTTGLLLYTVDFIGVLPAWWLALSGALAAGAMAALVAARRTGEQLGDRRVRVRPRWRPVRRRPGAAAPSWSSAGAMRQRRGCQRRRRDARRMARRTLARRGIAARHLRGGSTERRLRRAGANDRRQAVAGAA
jgi:hypothetical protein